MTDTFDWDRLAEDADNCDSYAHAADLLRTRIEAAFVSNRTVELLGECMENLTARAEAAEARVKVLEEALAFYAGRMSWPNNAWVQPVKVDYSMGGDGHHPDGPVKPSDALLADRGTLARQTLGAEHGK